MRIVLIGVLICCAFCVHAQWYTYDSTAVTRWSSPENINGQKGAGGKANNGAKGMPCRTIAAGDSLVLLNVNGTGIINRIWITVSDRSPEMLRSLKLEMYWDNARTPAVSVPIADFFGMSLGRMSTFQNALFASPEGRSFNCFIPMPFRKGAKIRVTNESSRTLTHIFFDIDYQMNTRWPANAMYFHAYWHRDTATAMTRDFELLPPVNGRGRLLGVNAGVNCNPIYGDTWWGEGEVKVYLDGDKNFPTLVGTGSEDYIGDAWGQSNFVNNYTGCLIADPKKKQWTFYRYHIPDPIYFGKNCRATIQQIGSADRHTFESMHLPDSVFIPATVDNGKGTISPLFEHHQSFNDVKGVSDYLMFYRSDDMCSTAYFYLDKPVNGLQPLQPLRLRTHDLRTDEKGH